MADQSTTYDTIVVGGGVSGAYCTWRLAQAGRQVALFEASSRIGGRLHSVTPPNMPDVRGELGGMRFLAAQQLVSSLVNNLQLQTQPFPVNGAQNIANVRNRLLRNSDFSNPSKVPYALATNEQGLNAGQLLTSAITAVIPNAKTLTPQQWEAVKLTAQFNGAPVYEWGFWNLLSQVLSYEAFHLLFDAGGYESMTDNWNAAEACQYLLLDFPSDSQYFTLANGMDSLPAALVQGASQAGAAVKTQYMLLSVKVNQGSEPTFNLNVLDNNAHTLRTFTANNLVLAMPKRSLELLKAGITPLNGGAVPRLIDSVMSMPAYKFLAAYESPWWKAAGVSSGRSTTDLPIRQCYYFGTETGATPYSLLLATYADGLTESFWEPLTKSEPWRPRDERHLALLKNAGPQAPARLVNMAQTFLIKMHGLMPTSVPEPYFTAFKDWTEDPYGGGWHFWKAGVPVGKVIGQVRQPVQNLNLFICGESYSQQQGWVEGALCSAEHVLQDHLGLSSPGWLPSSYYIGP